VLAASAQKKEKPFGTYPDSIVRLAHAPLTMGNILFGDDSRSNHDRKDRSDKEATEAECPMVRSTIHRSIQSERSERGPKSVEETGPPGNDRGDNRSSRMELVIDYNGAQRVGPERFRYIETESGEGQFGSEVVGGRSRDSKPDVFVPMTPEVGLRWAPKSLFGETEAIPGESTIAASPDSAYVSRPVEPDTAEVLNDTEGGQAPRRVSLTGGSGPARVRGHVKSQI